MVARSTTVTTDEKCVAETGEFFVQPDARQAHGGMTLKADRRSDRGNRRIGLRCLWYQLTLLTSAKTNKSLILTQGFRTHCRVPDASENVKMWLLVTGSTQLRGRSPFDKQ